MGEGEVTLAVGIGRISYTRYLLVAKELHDGAVEKGNRKRVGKKRGNAARWLDRFISNLNV